MQHDFHEPRVPVIRSLFRLARGLRPSLLPLALGSSLAVAACGGGPLEEPDAEHVSREWESTARDASIPESGGGMLREVNEPQINR